MTNSSQHHIDILQDRFAFKVASRLSDQGDALPYDISERLRAARMQAVARRKPERVQFAPVLNLQANVAGLGAGDEGLNLWGRLAALAPLIALVVGLIAINMLQNDSRAKELAEVDSALLTDDLPPSAYADPGFIQFLKTSQEAGR